MTWLGLAVAFTGMACALAIGFLRALARWRDERRASRHQAGEDARFQARAQASDWSRYWTRHAFEAHRIAATRAPRRDPDETQSWRLAPASEDDARALPSFRPGRDAGQGRSGVAERFT
jgi:hypothetical protein